MTRKSTRTKKDVAARRARAHELAAAGHTIAAIARELGCSGSTAHDMVRRRTRELKREGDQAALLASGITDATPVEALCCFLSVATSNALMMEERWDWWRGDEDGDESDGFDEVTVTFLQGRRGNVVDARFRFDVADRERVEPLVRAWLEPRWKFLKSEWEPVPTPSVVVSSTNRSARRPTLAECLGVPERWQALACLYAMLFSTWSHALAPWACGWSERASAAVLQGDEAAMRQVANYALETAADADEPEPERAICRELACELVERRRKQEAGR